jgi:hypothetical protein
MDRAIWYDFVKGLRAEQDRLRAELSRDRPNFALRQPTLSHPSIRVLYSTAAHSRSKTYRVIASYDIAHRAG